METLVLVMTIALSSKLLLCQEIENDTGNSTDPNKDMYVIHAMVYQVGIVSNKTDDDALNSTMGNQEAITLYHTNGSNIDLSAIPSPLMTNVTAQSLIGVAPKADNEEAHQVPWSVLEDLTKQKHNSMGSSEGLDQWTVTGNENQPKVKEDIPHSKKTKRSWEDSLKAIFKRDVTGKDTVRITKGTAEIPKEAGVQSIALPPLLSLNNNFSDIPVPIPNTSVVHYAKINTLVHAS